MITVIITKAIYIHFRCFLKTDILSASYRAYNKCKAVALKRNYFKRSILHEQEFYLIAIGILQSVKYISAVERDSELLAAVITLYLLIQLSYIGFTEYSKLIVAECEVNR